MRADLAPSVTCRVIGVSRSRQRVSFRYSRLTIVLRFASLTGDIDAEPAAAGPYETVLRALRHACCMAIAFGTSAKRYPHAAARPKLQRRNVMQARDSFFGRQPVKATSAPPPTPAPSVPAARPHEEKTSVMPAGDGREALKDAAKPDGTQRSQLIVGPNIRMKGVEITDCDTLVVEGHIEATMDSRLIQIAQDGTYSGSAGIDSAEIHGAFSGELTVRKCLTIYASGRVSGKIRYRKLVVEEGGEIAGEIVKLGDDDKPARLQPASAGNAVPVPNSALRM
jgi:cytoskeletal protein CcmA (bactofilin family)